MGQSHHEDERDAPPASERESTKAIERYMPQGMQTTEALQPASAALAARVEAEVKARTLVAVSRPRNVERFRIKLLESCARTAFADAAWYVKPIGGGKVEGLSIRFAEECARFYGNLDISSEIISEDDEKRIVQCCVVDLEVNVPWRVTVVVPKTVERRNPRGGDEVVRVRTNSQGTPVSIIRATADQVLTTQMALTSKAIRNLILAHIPSEIKEEAEEGIRDTLQSEVKKDPAAFRRKMVDAFYRIGISPEEIDAFLGKPLGNASEAEVFELNALGKAIKAGEATWADVMEQKKRGTRPTVEPASTGAERMRAATAKDDAKTPAKGTPAIDKDAKEAQRVAAIREKPASKRSDEEKEDLRQWDLDHPAA